MTEAVCVIPAVDDHGPSVRILSLLSVHLSEEAQDPSGLIWHTMIRPAHVLILPDGATMFLLQKTESQF